MSSPENGRRLEQVLDELRASAPPAPERLRARIDQLAAIEPARRPTLRERFSLGRAVLVLAPALLAVGLGVAVIGGISGSGGDSADETVAVGGGASAPRSGVEARRTLMSPRAHRGPPLRAASQPAGADRRLRGPSTGLPPARGRAQDYRASLHVRVDGLDELSNRTKEAIRLTRRWGGYVSSVDYDIPGAEGDARLELRVPVQHVQAAVQRFSELGTILAQDIEIRDVQGRLDRYTRDVLALRECIAELRADLRQPGLSEGERTRLELRLARARRAVEELAGKRSALARRVSFANVSLTLTTRDTAAAPADKQGRIERALGDAASILAREVAFGLYALIVAAPFLLLAAAAYFAARTGRRRADERLLKRA